MTRRTWRGGPAAEDPGDLGLDGDPGDGPPPEVDPGELAGEADRISGDLAREAAVLAGAGLTAASSLSESKTHRPGAP